MGRNIGESDELNISSLLIGYPLIIFIRMAQLVFSTSCFLFGLLLCNESVWSQFYAFLWRFFDFLVIFWIELSNLFCWLIWMFSVIKLRFIESSWGISYAFYLVLCGTITAETDKLGFRCNWKPPTVHHFDKRLMLLSYVRIYAHLALFYCHRRPTFYSLIMDCYLFKRFTYLML